MMVRTATCSRGDAIVCFEAGCLVCAGEKMNL